MAYIYFLFTAIRQRDPKRFDWLSDEVIFLEERACTVGVIVGLDGHFVVVSPHFRQDNQEKKLKVCLKASLTKVSDAAHVLSGNTSEFLINEDRYAHAIRDAPSCVVDPLGAEHLYNGYKAVAIAATKHGLAMLLNRLSDHRAFLVQPEAFKEDNSKVFTCNATNYRAEKEILVSDSNVTSEFESVCAKSCMLDVSTETRQTSMRNADDAIKVSYASMSSEIDSDAKTRQTSKRSPNDVVKTPHLMSVNTHGALVLLDRNSCLFPVKFGSCLLPSGFLECLPFRILNMSEANYGDEDNEEVSVTIIAGMFFVIQLSL